MSHNINDNLERLLETKGTEVAVLAAKSMRDVLESIISIGDSIEMAHAETLLDRVRPFLGRYGGWEQNGISPDSETSRQGAASYDV
jgi:hypothetical protein